MREIFRLIQDIKTWMRKEIPDPQEKLYTTYVFIVAGILHLKREEVPATKSEIISLTTVSASTVNRALPILEEQGLLKSVGKVWDFAVVVPDHLMSGNFGIKNNGEIKEMFTSFTRDVKSAIMQIQAARGSDDMDVDAIFGAIEEAEVKQREKKGAKGLMGDMTL